MVGFSKVVIEGDNVNVIQAISFPSANLSLLGNVVDDIRHLIRGLHWVSICCMRRGENKIAHVLAQHARNIIDDMYWMEDSPLPALEALYQDAILLCMSEFSVFKKKKNLRGEILNYI